MPRKLSAKLNSRCRWVPNCHTLWILYFPNMAVVSRFLLPLLSVTHCFWGGNCFISCLPHLFLKIMLLYLLIKFHGYRTCSGLIYTFDVHGKMIQRSKWDSLIWVFCCKFFLGTNNPLWERCAILDPDVKLSSRVFQTGISSSFFGIVWHMRHTHALFLVDQNLRVQS